MFNVHDSHARKSILGKKKKNEKNEQGERFEDPKGVCRTSPMFSLQPTVCCLGDDVEHLAHGPQSAGCIA